MLSWLFSLFKSSDCSHHSCLQCRPQQRDVPPVPFPGGKKEKEIHYDFDLRTAMQLFVSEILMFKFSQRLLGNLHYENLNWANMLHMDQFGDWPNFKVMQLLEGKHERLFEKDVCVCVCVCAFLSEIIKCTHVIGHNKVYMYLWTKCIKCMFMQACVCAFLRL